MPTLLEYWNDEVSRIDIALADIDTRLDALRIEVMVAENTQRDTADLVKKFGDEVAAARRALAGIAMPADGDPLLEQMQSALVSLHETRATLAVGQRNLLALRADLERTEETRKRLASESGAARIRVEKETQSATLRQQILDKFAAGGELETLIPDAATALTDHKATAVSRVESEFPTNSDADKSLLTRVRTRAQLVRDIVAGAEAVEKAAFAAEHKSLEVARRDFDGAVRTLLGIGEAGAIGRADIATLERLAALPAPNPPDSFPILTRWQRELLHDSATKIERENTLASLTAVDNARADVIPVQTAYEQALHAAMKAEPDKTIAELNSTTVSTEKAALDNELADLDTARANYAAIDAADRQLLEEWFASVPDALWSALEALDGAVVRLEALTSGPSPTDLSAAVIAAETVLEAELRASREAERQTIGAQSAGAWATAELSAERDTAATRATAMSHSNALF